MASRGRRSLFRINTVPWAATWTRTIVTWPRVKWHRETKEQVRNAPISLPAGFQLPTLVECLLRNLLAEKTNDLCLDFYPRLICLGNKSSLDIIMPCPPSVMTKADVYVSIYMRLMFTFPYTCYENLL